MDIGVEPGSVGEAFGMPPGRAAPNHRAVQVINLVQSRGNGLPHPAGARDPDPHGVDEPPLLTDAFEEALDA
ncbi:MAG: hypothetical protein V2I25_15750, partial [Woeseiaceae bacterium]|nr:hypothetical protein [Woeseiaceae bacterium]